MSSMIARVLETTTSVILLLARRPAACLLLCPVHHDVSSYQVHRTERKSHLKQRQYVSPTGGSVRRDMSSPNDRYGMLGSQHGTAGSVRLRWLILLVGYPPWGGRSHTGRSRPL